MDPGCKSAYDALHACKASVGLLPRQCYPASGYKGECDPLEFQLKRCLAFDANFLLSGSEDGTLRLWELRERSG